MQNETNYCCEAHVDIAVDDFLVKYETFPNLEKCEDKKCSYCDNMAEYKIT